MPIFVAAIYSTDSEQQDAFALRRVAEQATQRLKSIRQTNRVEVTGGQARVIQIELDSVALAAHSTTLADISRAVQVSNTQVTAGQLHQQNRVIQIESGQFFASAQELANSVVNVVNGKPVYLRDVAHVADGPEQANSYTFFYPGMAFAGAESATVADKYPAVFISVAKQRGSNAVRVADNVLAELEALQAEWLPAGVEYSVIRNYGENRGR